MQTINLAILAAQATFIGLVFPIVIALVSLLSDGKISYRGRLNLFLEETEATYVGASAIMLIATLLVQLLALSQLPERVGAACTALNITWFACNTYAIGFFLFQTLKYVQPDLRFQIEKRYIANIVWRNQLSELVRVNRWANAQHYGYWPNAEIVVGDKDEAPLVVTHKFHDQSDHRLSIDRGKAAQVRDVHLYLVGIVLNSWLQRYRDQDERSRFSWLEFCLSPQQVFEGRTSLLQIKSAPDLTKGEEALVKWAFKTGREKPLRDKGTVVQFIEDMISDLMRLAEEGRSSEFRTLLAQLTKLHAFLFDIAEAPREDEQFNYAQMTEGMGRDLSTKWASPYRDLHKKVVTKLASEPDLFESIAWWSPNIIGLARSSAFDASTNAAMLLSSHLLRRLLDWAASEYRSITGNETNASTTFEVPSQLRSEYGNAWRGYVASWERILDVLGPNIQHSDSAKEQWQEFQRIQKAYEDHLLRSVEHVALSAASGDQMAVRWSTDLLIKWPNGILFGGDHGNVFNKVQPVPITTDVVRLSWQRVTEIVVTEHPRSGVPDAWSPDPKDIWKSALDNFWSDACAVLTAVLTRWMIHYGEQGEAAEAARRVISQKAHDHGQRGSRDAPTFNFSTLLLAPLRIAVAQDGEDRNFYAGKLSELAGRMLDIGSPQYVSMRIYSGTGTGDYLSLTTEQVIVLASQVDLNDRPIRTSREARVLFDSAKTDEQRRLIIAHLEKLDSAIEDLDLDKVAPAFRALRKDGHTLQAATAALKQQLQAHIVAFENMRDQQFEDAEVDPNRLREIAEAASSLGFAATTANFPISMFEAIDFVDEHLTDFTLTSSDQNTGEYTRPLFSTPVSNEHEFWADVMKQRSATIVMRDLLQSIYPVEVLAPTAEAFWNGVQVAASAIRDAGQNPILIVASQSEPSWLIDWRWPHDEGAWRPKNLRIAQAENQPNGYLFHLNDLPVFFAPINRDCAYLLAKELLHIVQFTEFDGLPTQVEFEHEKENRRKGTIKLKFSRNVILRPHSAYRFVYREPIDDNEGA